MRSLYRRFDITLADDIARLGADAVCYSFIAADSHHLLFAGFYRRTENSSFQHNPPFAVIPVCGSKRPH